MTTKGRGMAEKPQWIAAVVGFVVGLIVTVMILGVTTGEEGAAQVMGRVAGAVLLTGIAMLLVLRYSPLWFRLSWFAIYALLLFGMSGLAVVVRERIRNEQLVAEAVQAAQHETQVAMQAANAGYAYAPKGKIERPKDARPHQLAAYLIRSTVRERIDNRNRYFADIKAADWEHVLEPDQLQRRDARAAADARVAAARKAVDDWIARENATTRRVMREVDTAELPSDFRRGFAKGLASSDLERKLEQSAASERAVIDATAELVNALLAHRWVYENDALLFHTDAGLEAYRSAQANLERRTRESEALDRRMQQDLQTRMQSWR